MDFQHIAGLEIVDGTLLYQQGYALTAEEQAEYPGVILRASLELPSGLE